MYINYPHDSEAQHLDTASRAIEGDQTHLRIQRGSVTLALSQNATTSQSVTFGTMFSPNTTPNVFLTLTSVGSISAKLNLVASSITNTGFTLQAYTDTAQTITVNYLAIGKEE